MRKVLSTLCLLAVTGPVGAQSDLTLDRLFAAYTAGDHAIVSRTFARPQEFQSPRFDARALDDWLSAWQPQKAAFLLDLATAANAVAPTRTWVMLSAGRRYLGSRPTGPGTAPGADAFERIWHSAALGLLQQHLFIDHQESYLDALQPRLQAAATLSDDRFTLARAIAQEQRCWADRPERKRAGGVVHGVLHAAGQPLQVRDGTSQTVIAEDRARHLACLSEAARRFDGVPRDGTAAAEARLRGAWIRFQLAQFPEASLALNGVAAGEDRDLGYWLWLIRGRVDDALGRHESAERAYRTALGMCPGAQSATAGLALTLFKMHRTAEADALGLAVRARSAPVDPWWAYVTADQRFVDAWRGQLRGARP